MPILTYPKARRATPRQILMHMATAWRMQCNIYSKRGKAKQRAPSVLGVQEHTSQFLHQRAGLDPYGLSVKNRGLNNAECQVDQGSWLPVHLRLPEHNFYSLRATCIIQVDLEHLVTLTMHLSYCFSSYINTLGISAAAEQCLLAAILAEHMEVRHSRIVLVQCICGRSIERYC